jgi:hypothetical protein
MPDSVVTLRDLTELQGAIERLTALIETEGARCPYREDIGRARNNVARLVSVEERVRAAEIRLAGIAGVSGGGVAGVVIIIGKALGWI